MEDGKTIITDKAEIRLLEDGIIENKIKQMAYVDYADVIEIKKANVSLSAGKKYVILVSAGYLATISKEARELSASKEFAEQTIAKALLIDSLGQKMVTNLYLSFNKPAIETKIFTDRDAALAWLRERLQKGR